MIFYFDDNFNFIGTYFKSEYLLRYRQMCYHQKSFIKRWFITQQKTHNKYLIIYEKLNYNIYLYYITRHQQHIVNPRWFIPWTTNIMVIILGCGHEKWFIT